MGLPFGYLSVALIVLLLSPSSARRITRECGPSKLDIVNADFAMNLLQESDLDINPLKSSILSPLSVAIALGMTYVGAEGNTYDQMNKVLAGGASDKEYEEYMKILLDEITATDSLNAANKVFIKDGFELRQFYFSTIQQIFEGQIDQIDFTQPAAAAEEINGWVSNQTNGKIRDLVQAGMFSARTRMVLVNAIYFNGMWKYAFDEGRTHKATFHVTDGVTKQVDMMTVRGDFLYYSDDQAQFLGLPYKTDNMYMYIVLPKERCGLSSLMNNFNGRMGLQYIHKATKQNVEVELPKFKLEEEVHLNRALIRMGIVDAFTGNANFSGISQEHLDISDVVHKAFIEVNEKGTEAAAATAIAIRRVMAIVPTPQPIRFTADHPFLFSINKGDTTLFIGHFY